MTETSPPTADASADPTATPSPRPLVVLHRLLAAAPGAEPEVLESLGPADEGVSDAAPDAASGDSPHSAVDFFFRRLSARLDEEVARVAEEWGPPGFHGTVEEPTFPMWSDALVLATWWHGDKVAYLAVRQEDDADPVTLEAGAHARDELDQLQSWHPAPPELGPLGEAGDSDDPDDGPADAS